MKEIKDFDGYWITEEGKVFSDWGKGPQGCDPKYRHELKSRPTRNGYLMVGLYKDSEQKFKLVHRLVIEAFIPNPLGLPQVNHKDENKTNNVVSNLEWCTHKDNCNYGTHNERVAKALTNRSDKSKPVIAYRDGVNIEYPSVSEAARQLGFDHSSISNCLRGRGKTCGGYTFRFRD